MRFLVYDLTTGKTTLENVNFRLNCYNVKIKGLGRIQKIVEDKIAGSRDEMIQFHMQKNIFKSGLPVVKITV